MEQRPGHGAGQWALAFLRSRWYPGPFQWLTVALLGLLLAFGFWGPDRGGRNLATVITWTLWWPLLPISLVLLGRVWCAICPLAAIASRVQRLFPPGRQRVPGVISRYGVWIMAAAFASLTWVDRVWGITKSPRATGLVLLLLLAGAVAISLAYQRRVWCRYLCPLGALSGLYAMAAPLALRPRQHQCHACSGKECYRGNSRAQGCPLWEFPGNLETNRNCNLCAQCVKACTGKGADGRPSVAMELRLRAPGAELGQVRRPLVGEAALALLMVALVYIQTIDMTSVWPQYMKLVLESTPLDYGLAFTVTLAISLFATMGSYWLAAVLGRRPGESTSRNFAAYGYAYLPLALAGHLGHNASHLLYEGPQAVQTTLDELRIPLALVPPMDESAAMGGINWPALAILGLGIVGAVLTVRRVARNQDQPWRQTWPHLVLLGFWSLAYLVVFLLPMNPRHSH
ncbi:MAG TPA: 4Fe-4S binding protein [Chloroflexota bacterium]|nr:4Fe-4S binding protein [Chloroflexota bacterium]